MLPLFFSLLFFLVVIVLSAKIDTGCRLNFSIHTNTVSVGTLVVDLTDIAPNTFAEIVF